MEDQKEVTTPAAKTVATEQPAMLEYFFPAHGITITAASKEDAEAQLAKKLQITNK